MYHISDKDYYPLPANNHEQKNFHAEQHIPQAPTVWTLAMLENLLRETHFNH